MIAEVGAVLLIILTACAIAKIFDIGDLDGDQ